MNEAGQVLWTRAAIKPRVVSASAGRVGFGLLTGGAAIRACHVSVTMRTVPRLPLGSLYRYRAALRLLGSRAPRQSCQAKLPEGLCVSRNATRLPAQEWETWVRRHVLLREER
jgi:hypothetical protein